MDRIIAIELAESIMNILLASLVIVVNLRALILSRRRARVISNVRIFTVLTSIVAIVFHTLLIFDAIPVPSVEAAYLSRLVLALEISALLAYSISYWD